MSLTQSGTGLRANNPPPGLKLSTSLFTAQPDESLAVVDAYEVQSSGVVNSISGEGSTAQDFMGSIQGAIAGVQSAVGKGTAALAAAIKTPMDIVKKGSEALRQVTAVAAQVTSAVNQIKNGGIMGTVSGLSSLAGVAGVQGAGAIASTASRVAAGVQRGGAGGALSAVSALAGNQGRSFNQLASNLDQIERTGARLKKAAQGGNFTESIYELDSTFAAASATLSSLDRASQADFKTGFDSAMGGGKGQSRGQSNLDRLSTSMEDFVGSWQEGAQGSATRAGVASGITVAAAANGDTTYYSQMCTSGLDDKSAFTAGTAVSAYATDSGNFDLLKDVSSTAQGRKSVSSNPQALRTTVTNMRPTNNQIKKAPAHVYDEITGLSVDIGQDWDSTQRAGTTVTDATAPSSSAYAREVVYAKAASDDFTKRTSTPRIDPTEAVVSKAQELSAIAQTQEQYKDFFRPAGDSAEVVRKPQSSGASEARANYKSFEKAGKSA